MHTTDAARHWCLITNNFLNGEFSMVRRKFSCARRLGVVPLLLVLAACGGGGGNGDGSVQGADPNLPPAALRSGVPEFVMGNYTVNEADGTIIVPVRRFGPSRVAFEATISASSPTAARGVDFTFSPDVIRFAADDIATKMVEVQIFDDGVRETAETVTLAFNILASFTTNGIPQDSRSRTEITILDNDPGTDPTPIPTPTPTPTPEPRPAVPTFSFSIQPKTLVFNIDPAPGATFYRLVRGVANDFAQGGPTFNVITSPLRLNLAVHLDVPSPQFRVEACNSGGCTPSREIATLDQAGSVLATGLIKASDSTSAAAVGSAVAISGDGSTVAIGAPELNAGAGAVYIYKRPLDGSAALSRLPVKLAPVVAAGTRFGASLALNEDGSILVVGAPGDANSTIIGQQYPEAPDQRAPAAGGLFVYQSGDGTWSQAPAYLKGSRAVAGNRLGASVAMSADGLTLVAGAPGDDSRLGSGLDTAAPESGTVFLYSRATTAEAWKSDLPLKNDVPTPDNFALFGASVAISDGSDLGGSTLKYVLVGAPGSLRMVGGAGEDVDGAAYLFLNSNNATGRVGMVKSPRVASKAEFGAAVALSSDASTVVIGAPAEDTFVSAGAMTGDGTDSGAIFVYRRTDLTGSMGTPAFIKAKFPNAGARFGSSLSITAFGDTIAVGSPGDNGLQFGVDGSADLAQAAPRAGAVDILLRDNRRDWSAFTSPASATRPTKRYIKASNTSAEDRFGTSVQLSPGGTTLVVGAPNEDSNYANFDDPNQGSVDNSLLNAGAAYLY
jgi:hypothetical protein